MKKYLEKRNNKKSNNLVVLYLKHSLQRSKRIYYENAERKNVDTKNIEK